METAKPLLGKKGLQKTLSGSVSSGNQEGMDFAPVVHGHDGIPGREGET